VTGLPDRGDGSSTPAHVAIVSFGYPPIPHVCGTRASMMARELVRLGHEVTVVTVDWRPNGDAAPEPELPRVIRIDPRRWHPAFRVDRPPFTTEPPQAGAGARRAFRVLRRIVAWGPFENWARAALDALVAQHARRPIDVVWAIHGDDSSHEVAFRFHRRTGVPWVADFKDPWNMFHPRASWELQWLATWRRLRTASSITEAAHIQAERDARFGRPTHVVWSGYDADLMADTPSRAPGSGFCLVYAGHVAPKQHDEDAIARMLRRWRDTRGAEAPIQLHFFGMDEAPLLLRALDARGVRDLVRFHPFVDRREVFALLKGAHALVMLATRWSPSGGSVGMKELEYFAAGTPVICLGRMLDEIRGVAGPQVVEALDEDVAVRCLGEEFDAFRSGASSPRRAEINAPAVLAHSWRTCALALSRTLESAARARGATLEHTVRRTLHTS
jgi:glycosyltransferase involved in cell wall biosynthesis